MWSAMWRIVVVFFLAQGCFAVDAEVLVRAGPLRKLYNPSLGEPTDWYINDHTLVFGPDDRWHMFGITHVEPADPIFEVNLAHATGEANAVSSSRDNTMTKSPFALGTLQRAGETHLWAPYVIKKNDGFFYMFYCGGGADRTNYLINAARSRDLFSWERLGTLFTGGIDGRDPMVMPMEDGSYMIYYTGTNPNILADDVSHVTYCRQSIGEDLLHWGEPSIAFNAGPWGQSCAGGPTESPFVIRRNDTYYLFSGAFFNYSDTHIFMSKDPKNFGVYGSTAVEVGQVYSHAPEVVRDLDGSWYVTAAGWGQGGLYISKLEWLDGLDDAPASLPIPVKTHDQSTEISTDSFGDFVTFSDLGNGEGQWNLTASGLLVGGSALGDSYATLLASTSNYSYVDFDILMITQNGDPTSTPGVWTRDNSGFMVVMNSNDPSNPLVSCIVLNVTCVSQDQMVANVVMYDDKGNLQPYAPKPSNVFSMQQGQWHHIRWYSILTWLILDVDDKAVYTVGSNADFNGYVSLGTRHGSAIFNNLKLH